MGVQILFGYQNEDNLEFFCLNTKSREGPNKIFGRLSHSHFLMLFRIHPAKLQKMQNHEIFLLMSYLQVFYTLSSFLVSKRAQWRGSFLHKRMHTGQTDIKIHTQEWTQVSADKQSVRHSSRVLGLRAELQRQSSRHLVGMRRQKRSSTQGRRLRVQNPDISGQHPIILGHRQFVNALALFALKVQLTYYCDVPLMLMAERGARERDRKAGEQKDLKSAN